MKEEVAPLILSDGDEASAVRFDALMYGIELAYLAEKSIQERALICTKDCRNCQCGKYS